MKNLKEKTEWIFWTTIAITFVLLEHNGTEPLFLIAYSLLPILILIFYWKKSYWPLVVYLLIFGFLGRYTRYFRENYASDVLLGIHDWIGLFLSGKNVYNEVIFTQTGLIPFVYLPFSLYWYLPAKILTVDLRFFEMIVSCFVPAMFFLYGFATNNKWRILPLLSVVALTPFLLDLSADGSNDNSAIFLLLASVVFLVFSKNKTSKKLAIISAFFLGLAASFKHYVFFYVFFFSFFLFRTKSYLPVSWKKYLLICFLTFALISLPFIISSPLGFSKSLVYIEISNQKNHQIWGWNLWTAIKELFNYAPSIQQMWLIRTSLVLTVIIGVLRFLKIDQLNKVFLASSLTILVYLIFSQWTTYAYFTFLVPLICLSALNEK